MFRVEHLRTPFVSIVSQRPLFSGISDIRLIHQSGLQGCDVLVSYFFASVLTVSCALLGYSGSVASRLSYSVYWALILGLQCLAECFDSQIAAKAVQN